MSVSSGFYNSKNHDRKYDSTQFSDLLDGIITNGVFASVGTAFQVKAAPDGTSVDIGVGRAWFNGRWLYNDSIFRLSLPSSEILLDRYDAVVIEINDEEATRNGTIKYIKGTPASSPKKPIMANTKLLHQHPLVYIYRKAESTKITQSDIENRIGTSECPYITGVVTNQNIDKIVAQWESQFGDWRRKQEIIYNQWFKDLQKSLQGVDAASLAVAVQELKRTKQNKIIFDTKMPTPDMGEEGDLFILVKHIPDGAGA